MSHHVKPPEEESISASDIPPGYFGKLKFEQEQKETGTSYTSNYQDPRINELLKAIRKPATEEEAIMNAEQLLIIMADSEKRYFKRGAIFAAVVTSLMFITYFNV